MIEVIVSIAAATICFTADGSYQCHNALVGPATPRGTYELRQRTTQAPGYGGDVLQFKETADFVWALHRVWLLKPEQKREWRLQQSNPTVRNTITNGCINVAPEIYDKLVDCCSNATLVVQ